MLRIPCVYAALLLLRLRLAFAKRAYYTMTPQSGHNKTAPAAVLRGSMFPKPCASAQGRVPCTRAAAQAAALRLLYHDAAKRPQQNRTCCGFAWFNVLKTLCASTGACALHTRGRASGSFEVIIPYVSPALNCTVYSCSFNSPVKSLNLHMPRGYPAGLREVYLCF